MSFKIGGIFWKRPWKFLGVIFCFEIQKYKSKSSKMCFGDTQFRNAWRLIAKRSNLHGVIIGCHRSVLTRRSGSLMPRWRDRCPEICLFRRDFVFCINNIRISKLFSDSQIRWKWCFWFLRSRGCNPRSMKVTLSLSRRSTNPAWDSCRNASF